MTVATPAAGAADAGRRGPRPGTARAAFGHRAFRRVWAGTMASNVGTWMQNVALGALAYRLTGSTQFVALVGFVQLGPILLLANVGGILADRFDRRKLLALTNLQQLAFSVVLGVVALSDRPSRAALVATVLALGVGNALAGPALSSLLPGLVPRRDLSGAVSLLSVQINLSRVIGPAIGGLSLRHLGFSGVFFVNAATYLFAVAAVLTAPGAKPPPPSGGRLERLVAGFRIARRDRVVGSVLLTITGFSFLCLPFIGLMPVVAAENLGLDVKGSRYGLLFAGFGVGAAAGAMAVGSLFVGADRQRLLKRSLLAFGGLLAAWALLRHPVGAYPVLLLLGAAYFTVTTVLATTLQEHLDDAVRGRVMALYMMGFGGTVPIGLIVFGTVADRVGVTPVLLVGAVAAVLLAVAVHLRREPVSGGLDAPTPEPDAELPA